MIRNGPSTNRPFIETYNPGVDNRSISDNLSDLDIEGKLDQFSSDEFSSVTFMLESTGSVKNKQQSLRQKLLQNCQSRADLKKILIFGERLVQVIGG